MNHAKTLVVFDVDGVLVEERSSWGFIHRLLGVERVVEVNARLYWGGLASYRDWMFMDTLAWLEAEPGLTREYLRDALAVLETVAEAFDAVELLRSKGFEVAIVSAGVDLVAERVARELRVRVWRSPRLLFDSRGRLLPGGEPLVEPDAKHAAVLEVAREHGARRVCVVGDSRIDAPAMKLFGCGVAVRPMDDVVRRAARIVARDPLDAAEALLSMLA